MASCTLKGRLIREFRVVRELACDLRSVKNVFKAKLWHTDEALVRQKQPSMPA